MIVLHAGMLDARMVLWAEQAPEDDAPLRQPGGRAPRAARPHPFAARHHELIAALDAAGLARWVSGEPFEAAAWLPTRGRLPVPSSPLVAELASSRARLGLSAWLVDGLALPAADAVTTLCAAVNRNTLAPGVVVGADLRLWTEALRLAGALVARQRFLPGLGVAGGAGYGGWRPVPAAEDFERAARLAAAMPPAARSLSDPEQPEAPTVAPRALVDGFIALMVDHLVRTSAEPLAPRRRQRGTAAFDSAHELWLHALRSADGGMKGDPHALAELAAQVQAWEAPLAALAAAPYRLCLRLDEPEAATDEAAFDPQPAEDQPWRVRFLVQAADDPSLRVPAEDLWSPEAAAAPLLERAGADVHQFLLAALGQASAISPGVEASLRSQAPAGYDLDANGAHAFLTEEALLLEQAGFKVLLPAWWTGRLSRARLAARAKVKSPPVETGSGLSLDRLVSFNWEVALGDQVISRDELEALARLKAPLVRLRGQWVELSSDELKAAIALWKKRGEGSITAREVVHMALGAGPPAGALEVEGVSADGWVGELLDRLEGRRALDEQAAPADFVGTLRPYQVRGYSWLAFLRELGLGACLADDMGLGKTIQALALVQRDRARGERRPVLLVCPTSVVTNWQREAARFTPRLPVLVHHGARRRKGDAFADEARQQALVITTYALLQRDLEHFELLEWGGVILDEAQNVKNPDTKQARAARALPAEYRVALTGTPVENNVGDLWSIMEFLNSGLLGSQAGFQRRFFIPIQARRDAAAAERLKRLTGPFVLRRLKTDRTIIEDLPDKQELKVYCPLTKEQASLYRAVAKETEAALQEAEGMQRRGLVLSTILKLKQVCNHPAQLLADGSRVAGRSGKLTRLVEMLQEVVDVGDRALVFTQFAEMGRLLQRHLQQTFGREVPFLHGGVPKKRRDVMVDRFQQQDEAGPPIFLLSLKAGGTGLNLTRANHVFHFDRWWNPAVEDQATDRAFRIGQTRDVLVHKLLCAGTLEDTIDALIERKKDIAGRVVGSGEGWLTELSNDELRHVFELRAEAIEG